MLRTTTAVDSCTPFTEHCESPMWAEPCTIVFSLDCGSEWGDLPACLQNWGAWANKFVTCYSLNSMLQRVNLSFLFVHVCLGNNKNIYSPDPGRLVAAASASPHSSSLESWHHQDQSRIHKPCSGHGGQQETVLGSTSCRGSRGGSGKVGIHVSLLS